ncbi:unnamed protein product [Prunus armeniaca]
MKHVKYFLFLLHKVKPASTTEREKRALTFKVPNLTILERADGTPLTWTTALPKVWTIPPKVSNLSTVVTS